MLTDEEKADCGLLSELDEGEDLSSVDTARMADEALRNAGVMVDAAPGLDREARHTTQCKHYDNNCGAVHPSNCPDCPFRAAGVKEAQPKLPTLNEAAKQFARGVGASDDSLSLTMNLQRWAELCEKGHGQTVTLEIRAAIEAATGVTASDGLRPFAHCDCPDCDAAGVTVRPPCSPGACPNPSMCADGCLRQKRANAAHGVKASGETLTCEHGVFYGRTCEACDFATGVQASHHETFSPPTNPNS